MLAPLSDAVRAEMTAGLPIEVVVPAVDDAAGVAGALREADLVIYDWRSTAAGLDARAIAEAPRLAFVQQPSVGVPAHDLDALTSAGVPLSNAAGFNTVAVTEWVLGAVFGAARHFRWVEGELRSGRWPQVDVIARGPVEIGGRRIGLVGFGPVGQALVPVFAALGCPVSYWSRSKRPTELELGATYRELDPLIADSDVLINVIALGETTRGLLSAERLATLPAGALVINASRGGIVDEDAVLHAVETGHLAGAAFDVYATEPLPADSPLRRSDRILLTSHTAGSTVETFGRLVALIRDNLARATSGAPVRNVVNDAGAVVRRRL
ncbi:MAG: D-isomer specific 2-hydroxyacid dehydrogenase NAD-binding protein [Ilumatobacteraceae bacterium]|nr:D-isomer specific 2-hydroxyacid dehydrogenase NAD-binding protein [Ilumatobacteraceae bacterium]